ncbi:ADP-ribosylglycohydrolase family protein [Chitinophaga sp. MM2321]|uniref:ADP-ribosylglycohydrolase family protein n=1 Tax=Chitinophaga sp. MM2321 TaxID=3137178 RepID=UPI0032D57FD3
MKILSILSCVFLSVVMQATAQQKNTTHRISKTALQDKIKGGWAGQTIGVTFGGPYEFQYNGTFIQDYQPLEWHEGYVKHVMANNPGLYDDLYMDLTFVDIFERFGLDAPIDSFANAFANAGYTLWHANQAARYNILNGIKAPASGHWLQNIHADDIDYQIEADYAGLMSPGMPNTASAISDKIGHIMNYGDGWYGGVYVGAMYTLAFTSNDIKYIVKEALKTIPAKSKYYQCMSDVIKWHQQFPNDWHRTWFELQKKWSSDIACPGGVFVPLNIDATINSAYVILGLLYGNGDYEKTLEISTRAGQDADCNPSTAAGILGTMLGYDKIPEKWKAGLNGAEDMDFKYTTISLNKVYDIGYRHALENIKRNGGTINENDVVIKTQVPQAVKFEESFPGMYPVAKKDLHVNGQEISFSFEGTGFVLSGYAAKKGDAPDDAIEATVQVDGKIIQHIKLPTSYLTRRDEICYKLDLPMGKHDVKVTVTNQRPDNYELRTGNYIVFNKK